MHWRRILLVASVSLAVPVEVTAGHSLPVGGGEKPAAQPSGFRQRGKRPGFAFFCFGGNKPMTVIRAANWHPSEMRYRLYVYPGRNILRALWRTWRTLPLGGAPRDSKGIIRNDNTMMIKVHEMPDGTSEIAYAWRGNKFYLGQGDGDHPLHQTNGPIRRNDIPQLLTALERHMQRPPDGSQADIYAALGDSLR